MDVPGVELSGIDSNGPDAKAPEEVLSRQRGAVTGTDPDNADHLLTMGSSGERSDGCAQRFPAFL